MKLTSQAIYAVHALVYLTRAKDHRLIPSHKIARAAGIPERFLLKILNRLSAVGLVHSLKGARGGYRLGKPSERITLLEIIETLDGPAQSAALAQADCM